MVGGRLTRFEGSLKLTGAATYALEYPIDNLAHAALVQSTIAAGRVVSVDATRALASPGVLMVLTPEDDLGLRVSADWQGNRPEDKPYHPLPRESAVQRPVDCSRDCRKPRTGDRGRKACCRHL